MRNDLDILIFNDTRKIHQQISPRQDRLELTGGDLDANYVWCKPLESRQSQSQIFLDCPLVSAVVRLQWVLALRPDLLAMKISSGWAKMYMQPLGLEASQLKERLPGRLLKPFWIEKQRAVLTGTRCWKLFPRFPASSRRKTKKLGLPDAGTSRSKRKSPPEISRKLQALSGCAIACFTLQQDGETTRQ